MQEPLKLNFVPRDCFAQHGLELMFSDGATISQPKVQKTFTPRPHARGI